MLIDFSSGVNSSTKLTVYILDLPSALANKYALVTCDCSVGAIVGEKPARMIFPKKV